MLFHGVAKIQHGVAGSPARCGRLRLHRLCLGRDHGADTDHLGLFTPRRWLRLYAGGGVFDGGHWQVYHYRTWRRLWGIENELVFFMGELAILLLGSGKYAIARNEAYR